MQPANAAIRFASAASIMLTSSALGGGGGSAEFCVEDPIAIEDFGAQTVINFDVDLPEGAIVIDATLSLQMDHEWVGDLVVSLQGAGAEATVLDRPGTGASFPFGCGGDGIDAVFRDAATPGAGDNCSNTADPVIFGAFQPVTPFTPTFGGLPATGPWSLAIRDAAQFDAGILQSACLTIEYVIQPSCDADFDGDGQVGSADLSQLLGLWGADCAVTFPCADLDGDAMVTSADLAALLGAWGPCS